MYKTKDYRAKPLDALFADIDDAAQDWPDAHRVFLADGDALTLETDHLLAILQKLRATLPALARVSCYATPLNLNQKSHEELMALKAAGLTLVYLGVESGSEEVFTLVRRGSAQAMGSGLAKAADSGLKVSATVSRSEGRRVGKGGRAGGGWGR